MDENALKELKRLKVYDDEGHYVMTFMEAFNIIKDGFEEGMKNELDKMFARIRAEEVLKPINPVVNCFDVFKDPKGRD